MKPLSGSYFLLDKKNIRKGQWFDKKEGDAEETIFKKNEEVNLVKHEQILIDKYWANHIEKTYYRNRKIRNKKVKPR